MSEYPIGCLPSPVVTLPKKSCIVMRELFLALALVFLTGIGPAEAIDTTPADPLATPEAKWLLRYLGRLPSKKSTKLVSGQYHLPTDTERPVDTIHAETGIWVGLLTESFNDAFTGWDHTWANAVRNRQALLTYWNAGGIAQVHMPMNNPKTKGVLRDYDFTNADMISARTVGTAINANLRQWLDIWATHAQWLADRHVPLIVRPLHEHNCCFWYADKPDLPNFYRYIFDYLTKAKRLHNLLFAHSVSVWGNNNGPKSDKHQYMAFYPGDGYVDLMAFDLYRDLSPSDAVLTSSDFAPCGYFKPRKKPIALAEFGPDDASPNPARADYRKLIKGIRSYCPDITYWNSWSALWSMTAANNSFVKQLLSDPWVANLADIPAH